MINLRYKDKGTSIHRLNPFSKLLWVGSIFILALLFDHPVYVFLLFLSTLPVIIAAGIWREWASLIRFALYLCVAIIFINTLVSYHGSSILWQADFRIPVLGVPAITLEAIVFGAGMSLRLLAIISAFTILTFTVHPDDIMLAMLKLKLPYKSVLVTSLSTRFIPTLLEDAVRISDVQKSRGVELERGTVIRRIKNRMSIIIPLLSNSLDRTAQVAEAMESRAFGSGRKRSFYREITLRKLDAPALASGFMAIVLGIMVRCWDQGTYQYYPVLESLGLDSFAVSMLALLMFLLCSIVPLALLKKGIELD